MKTISTRSRIGSDGILKLRVPTDEREKNVEVVIVIQEENKAHRAWPAGFFKQTYGSLKKYKIERPGQGEFERREKIQ